MREHQRPQRDHHHVRPRGGHPLGAEERAAHPLLVLQRQVGNRAVARMLRAEAATPAIARTSYNEEGPIGPACVLTTYAGSNFTGKTVVADVQFVASLQSINKHAVDNDVNLLITDSFRPHGRPVKGAIVPPATR